MTQANSSPPATPSQGNPPDETWSLKGFISFANSMIRAILDIFDIVVEPFFKIIESGRIVRSLLILFGFFVWAFAAYSAHPPNFAEITPWFNFTPGEGTPEQIQLMLAVLQAFQQVTQLIVAAIVPFFAPDIFRHVLVIGLASWIAFEWAAIYLDDIFELKNTEISRKFILKAAFVGRLERVHIQDGDVADNNRDSPVIRIGGPGQVVVHLENAVLFEKINGEAHIITSSMPPKEALLDGFERLRTVKYPKKTGEGYAIFDRRDQFIGSQTVVGRTKDGILVTAKNVSAVFSIHEGEVMVAEPPVFHGGNGKIVTQQISRRISDKFDREALETSIKNLVYNQVNRPWTETARQNIFPNVRSWIGKHTLDEFLTNLSPQELAEVRERGQSPGGQSPLPSVGSVYLSRAELTNAVQGEDLDAWSVRGFDVHWVGVGTWETPEQIPEQHKKAFELSVQNRIAGSEIEISRIHRESRIRELVRLMEEVPIKSFKDSMLVVNRNSSGMGLMHFFDPEYDPAKAKPSDIYGKLITDPRESEIVKYKLVIAYREKLKMVRDWYERNNQTAPEELQAAIKHLSKVQPPPPKP